MLCALFVVLFGRGGAVYSPTVAQGSYNDTTVGDINPALP